MSLNSRQRSIREPESQEGHSKRLEIDRVHFIDQPELLYLPTGPHLLQVLDDPSAARTGPPMESSAWPDGPTTEHLEGLERGRKAPAPQEGLLQKSVRQINIILAE